MAALIPISLPSPWSDGDGQYWPTHTYVAQPTDRLYHEKLATMWMHSTDPESKGMLFCLSHCLVTGLFLSEISVVCPSSNATIRVVFAVTAATRTKNDTSSQGQI
jgi:hypothetical protein